MLRYTGHPIADVGVATVAAFCEKPDPTTLSKADLRRVARFLEKEYFSGKLLSYLTCVFVNSAYVQPKMKKENVEAYKKAVLYGFEDAADPSVARHRCAFSGEPADRIVFRQHVPMLTGEDVLNFFPAGIGGLPISGPYLLAIQAFPLGARRCHGRALAVHCPDDPTLTYAFARRFLSDNRRLLLLAEKSGEKYLDAKAPKTLVASTLLEIENERRDRGEEGHAPSVTIYHLTSSGQGPDIDVFQLPSEVVQFLRKASRAGTHQVWAALTARAWEKLPAEKKRSKSSSAKASKPASTESGPGVTRNYLYEDLFALPGNAARFVRVYFLRRAYRYGDNNDPRLSYRVRRELDLVSWDLTHLFLKEVFGMERKRIDAIRNLGDRLAQHITTDNDRRLFQALYRADRYFLLRNSLIKASQARLRKGDPPLVRFDEFVTIFEEGEEAARVDWGLARDLMLIRLIEELHRQQWFGRQPEVLEELEEELPGVAATG